MSMGSAMMQQAELQRKEDVAKSRPISVSKIQVAVTGAASLIPGSQSLSACSLGLEALFIRARDVNLSVARKELLGRIKKFLVGYVGQPRLVVFRHGSYVHVDIEHPPTESKKESSEYLTECDDSTCPFVTTVVRAWYGSGEEFAEALQKLREKVKTPKLHYLLVKHDKNHQYQPYVFNWLSRWGPRRPEGFEKPEEPQEPQFFQLGY